MPETGDALSTHTFGVQLGGIQVASVKEISGLSVKQEVVESTQVTDTGKQMIRKQPGRRQAGEITLVRGFDAKDDLAKWIKKTLNEGDVDSARQDITIEIKDAKGNTVRRLHLYKGWVSDWEGPALSAEQSGAATETVTITFEEIKVE